MKTGKKVMILLLIFVAAVIVYFIHPVGKKEEHGITEYTAMEKAKFPVLYATMGEREMAPVFGQTEERGVTADRGSLIVLPEDRKLKVRFAGTTKIQGLRYEIRSLDTEDLIERTQVTSLDAAINGDSENAVSAELLIQNLLETGKEYLLGVCASLPGGSEAWYYMRIVEQDPGTYLLKRRCRREYRPYVLQVRQCLPVYSHRRGMFPVYFRSLSRSQPAPRGADP